MEHPQNKGLGMTLSDHGPAWDALSVSHEAWTKLEAYEALLLEWAQKFNLVAPSTLPHVWTRHFLDSAQLYPLIPAGAKTLVDLGSGAGFPGLVLSILGVPDVHLVESVGKKTAFLRHVAQELGLAVTVHGERAEAIHGLQADVVTARALSALPDLLSLAKPFMGRDSITLFLKGEKADAELTAARKYWTFKNEKKQSLSDPSGTVLIINELKVLRAHDPKRRKSTP